MIVFHKKSNINRHPTALDHINIRKKNKSINPNNIYMYYENYVLRGGHKLDTLFSCFGDESGLLCAL